MFFGCDFSSLDGDKKHNINNFVFYFGVGLHPNELKLNIRD